MTVTTRNSSKKTGSTEQALRDEIAGLRAELDQARAQLEHRDRHCRELSGMLNIGVWEWDEIAGAPIYYSDELAEIFGVSSDEFARDFRSPRDFERLVFPEDRPKYRQHLDASAVLEPGVTHTFDYRIVDARGGERQLREFERGVFDESGKLVTSIGLVQDISEVQNSIAALRESEERYSSLFDQLPLGVQEEDYSAVKKVVDKLRFRGVEDLEDYFLSHPRVLREMISQTHITNVNAALVRLHEAASREEFLSVEANLDEWWDAQWVSYYASEVAALAGPKKYYECERVDSKIDGRYFETRARVTLVCGCEDNWERVITIHEDITERKQAEAALIEARVQAEQANQAKSDFLSSMSHELRTPLNAILGFSQLFAYDRNLSEQHLANATEINRAGRHLMSLIDQILDLERIEAGETGVSLEPVSLLQVLGDSVRWVEPLAGNRGITVDYDEGNFDGLTVLADTIRLKQVFLNLLTNAVKYNREGGSVQVVSNRVRGGALRVGIRDSGNGISPERIDELFQPFNRLGAEFSTVEGTGIGLVITRQLLDLMQGELEIDSEPGAGSTFWVVLRQVEAPRLAGEHTPPHKAAAADAAIARILVAEDNRINRDLLGAQLELLGYDADFAEDGEQALARWRQQGYDLLLTDIRMPNLDGYELVREIRRRESSGQARLPVIAISANALGADAEKCYAAGVDDVIHKPVELENLRLALAKWVPQGEPRAGRHRHAAQAGRKPSADAMDLEVLRHSIGDKPELQHELLTAYRQEIDDEIERIQRAFSWKNHEQLAEHCHKLKSSSRSLGASGVADACGRLETAAGRGDWADIEALLPCLLLEANRAGEFSQSFLGDSSLPGEGRPGNRQTLPQLAGGDDEVTQFSISLLVVDDDYIMHRITTVMLRDLGISRILNAMSGPEALKILQQGGEPVDVIICDLNMPDMDGVEFIRHLAKRKFDGSLILTSGENFRVLKTVEKLAIEHDLHMLGVLEKPIAPARLGQMLESLDQIRQEGTMMVGDSFSIADLGRAIDENQLDAYFQPKVAIESGEIVGVEALVRWNHPEFGVIRPNAFIPMAEEHGMITRLTEVVCNLTIDYAVILKSLGYELDIAINISVDALNDLAWPDHMAALLDQRGLAADKLSFEITESRLMGHLSVALDILSRLSLKRFNLSIDDFGTGYSSMEQLQRVPFSEFKIDRAFVHGAAEETSARAILESSVLLAKKLDMKVVAEGVEDQQDWDLVAELGCDQVQGYFVARPMPFGQLCQWLEKHQPKKSKKSRFSSLKI